MSNNCFLQQEATVEILSNVADFCSECYTTIVPQQTIFYDMQNYRFICETCQSLLNQNLDENCDPIENELNSLFV